MRIKIGSGLLPQNLALIFLITIIVFLPSNIFRIIFGLPVVLFFPGHALILTLFPKRDQISNIERIALSFGTSIVIVSLIGLILNYTPLGITVESTLYSIAGFSFLTSVIAWFRLKRLSEYDRFSVEAQLRLPGWGGSRWDRALSIILVIAILGSIGMLSYAIAAPKVGEKFTEFYVLGTEGRAEGYPEELSVGEEGKVIVGVVNHEQDTTSYRIEILVDGSKENEIGPIILENDGKWEEEVTFTPSSPGENQKVEFLLYKEGQTNAYHSLYIRIDVKAQ